MSDEDDEFINDPLAELIAALDQYVANLPHIMALTRACFIQALREGFNDQQALEIAINLSKAMQGLK